GVESTRPSRIGQGDHLNTDVTSPAALVAISLVFLGSGDRALAERMSLPQTHFQLDYARPELMLLRVVARALVLWDDVQPTQEWVDMQIPGVVQMEYERLHEPLPEELTSVVDRQTIRQAHSCILAGAYLSLGLRFAGTGDRSARATLLRGVRHFKNLRDCHPLPSGSSLRGNRVPASSPSPDMPPNDPWISLRRPERPILEMCLAAAVSGLGMVMAGTGDLDSLRLLRELRWRVEGPSETTYGTHMAISMGIGLLFLGGGMSSLGRDKEHVGVLLAAFYPRYPATIHDNQYHLQALRHLYVLAVQRRGVDAVDVDTGESVYVPLKIITGPSHHPSKPGSGGRKGAPGQAAAARSLWQRGVGGYNGSRAGTRGEEVSRLEAVTPCILPDLREVVHVEVCSPRYFPVRLDLGEDEAAQLALQRHYKIYVKRRTGHLSYKNDPHALRSLLFQSFPIQSRSRPPAPHGRETPSSPRGTPSHGHGGVGSASLGPAEGGQPDVRAQSKEDFLSTFTEDPHLLNFAKHFCGDTGAVVTMETAVAPDNRWD
ncbi:unnamed protein product, partial [Discosporangium mesarthrocarpum]